MNFPHVEMDPLTTPAPANHDAANVSLAASLPTLPAELLTITE
jgi:hypothetical protein